MTSNPVDELRANLTLALQDYRNSDATLGSSAALHAVCVFLQQIGIEPKLLTPITDLLLRTADVNRAGSTKPLFDSTRMATGAAAIDTLLREVPGIGVKNAIKQVCKEMGGDVTPAQMEEFRKNLGKRRARSEAIDHYDRVKATLKTIVTQWANGVSATDRPKVVQKAILYGVQQICGRGKKG